MTVFEGNYGTGDPRTIGLDHLIELLARVKSFEFREASAKLWDDEPVPASHRSTAQHIPNAQQERFSDLLRSLEESKLRFLLCNNRIVLRSRSQGDRVQNLSL
ncbi:hypothetical protein BD410DRAFT_789609 [Rickenella mellea]|uniref:Uncharacterized protein n=1 Tax=Rickenella mellea TaxID=50990 RepID=A0A4Y7Q2Q7_9AGAM|nr:hypothetical protein BD410DRAFT_789609 [Rickenella mellea]